jgi:hypothetical protein
MIQSGGLSGVGCNMEFVGETTHAGAAIKIVVSGWEDLLPQLLLRLLLVLAAAGPLEPVAP